MCYRKTFRAFNRTDCHKGFYNDDNPTKSLSKIDYTDFQTLPDDDEFPYISAHDLLCGSCECFALALKAMFDYNVYIIEEKGGQGFHVFCQIYKKRNWYYVDARGITTSFSEFMDIAKIFLHDEYIIRPVDANDIDEWESDSNYNEEGYAFAEAVITKYKECYTLE